MKKVIVLIILAWYVCLSLAETADKKDKTEDVGQRSSESVQSLPLPEPRLEGNLKFLMSPEKRISALEDKVAALEARISCLEVAFARQIPAIQTALTNLTKSAGRPPTYGGPTTAAYGPTFGFIKAKGDSYVFSANGARIEIDPAGNITIAARMNITVESNATTSVKSSVLELDAATMTLESSRDTHINSKLLRLNNGSRPVAGQGDKIRGVCPPHGGPLLDATIKGSGAGTILVP